MRVMTRDCCAQALSMKVFTAKRPIRSSQLVRPQPATCRVLAREFILIFRDVNYKRRPHSRARFTFHRVTSVAAMQEQLRNSLANCRGLDGSPQLWVQESTKPGRSRLDQPGFRSPKCR